MGSIFMFKRKVSPEEKITAVESYLNGDRQLHTILEQYGIAKEAFRIRVVRRKEPGTLWSKRRRAGVWRQSAGLTGCTYGTGSSFTPLQGAPELPGTLPRAKKHATGMFFTAAMQPPPFRVPPDVPKSGPSIRMTRFLVRQKGLEPPTLGTGIRCSIH